MVLHNSCVGCVVGASWSGVGLLTGVCSLHGPVAEAEGDLQTNMVRASSHSPRNFCGASNNGLNLAPDVSSN